MWVVNKTNRGQKREERAVVAAPASPNLPEGPSVEFNPDPSALRRVVKPHDTVRMSSLGLLQPKSQVLKTVRLAMSGKATGVQLPNNVHNVRNVKLNDDGTFTLGVGKGSQISGVTFDSEGEVTFNAQRNSICIFSAAPDLKVFRIKEFDKTAEPVTLVRGNVDIQIEKGLFLTKGEVKVVFSSEERNGNYIFLSDKNIQMGGKGFSIQFNEDNPVVNIHPQDTVGTENLSLSKILEISAEGGNVLIENRNVPGSSPTHIPKITIVGEESDVWITLRNGNLTLQAGKDGLVNQKISKEPKNKERIPVELSITTPEGLNLIKSEAGEALKMSFRYAGKVAFAPADAEFNLNGVYLYNRGSIPHEKIESYEKLSRQFINRAFLNTIRDEYERRAWEPHNFQPEYSQDLQHISLYIPVRITTDLLSTQIEIMKKLPDYTKIKVFYSKGFNLKGFEKELPKDIYSRITFFEVPDKGASYYDEDRPSPWAQDYTEGDHEIQILPLTYLGAGVRNTVDHPQNNFIYNLERGGVTIRRAPVEFAGGNVFIAKDGNGEKILLVGGDSYLETLKTYEDCGETISEEGFKQIMKDLFQVEDVQILARRTSGGAIEEQNGSIFHIDQTMLPIDDGVVAMPVVTGLEPPNKTVEEIRQDKNYQALLETKKELDQFRELMRSRGFKIIDLKINASNILQKQAFTNSLVYRDKNTGRKTVIMPIFPDEHGDYKLEGLNLENKKAYEAAGYDVKTVQDKAYKKEGNMHCLTILAAMSEKTSSSSLS